jgi:hypothetical protein
MKLVREHINEFERGGDPLKNLNIGIETMWNDWHKCNFVMEFIQKFVSEKTEFYDVYRINNSYLRFKDRYENKYAIGHRILPKNGEWDNYIEWVLEVNFIKMKIYSFQQFKEEIRQDF